MIGSLTYNELKEIINLLNSSNEKIKKIIAIHKEQEITGTARMNRFTLELDTYINYLKTTYQINEDADLALSNLKELSS